MKEYYIVFVREYEEDGTKDIKGFYISGEEKAKTEKRFREITGTKKKNVLEVREM